MTEEVKQVTRRARRTPAEVEADLRAKLERMAAQKKVTLREMIGDLEGGCTLAMAAAEAAGCRGAAHHLASARAALQTAQREIQS